MKFSTTLWAACLFVGLSSASNFTFSLGAVDGFRITQGFRDGMYEIEMAEGDIETGIIVRRLRKDVQRPVMKKRSGSLFRRLRPKVPFTPRDSACREGQMDMEDYEQAKFQFLDWCDREYIPKKSRVMQFGSNGETFVYACSSGGMNPCDREEWDFVEEYMEKTMGCLEDQPAWMYIREWRKEYGRANTRDMKGICPNRGLDILRHNWFCTWNPLAVQDKLPLRAFCFPDNLPIHVEPVKEYGQRIVPRGTESD